MSADRHYILAQTRIDSLGWSLDLMQESRRNIDLVGVGVYAYLTLARPIDVASSVGAVHSWMFLFCRFVPGISKLLTQYAPIPSLLATA